MSEKIELTHVDFSDMMDVFRTMLGVLIPLSQDQDQEANLKVAKQTVKELHDKVLKPQKDERLKFVWVRNKACAKLIKARTIAEAQAIAISHRERIFGTGRFQAANDFEANDQLYELEENLSE